LIWIGCPVNAGGYQLRGLDVILAALVAMCGIVQIYLILTFSDPEPILGEFLLAMAIGSFLVGITRLKHTEQVSYEVNKWKAWISILLILNAILFVILWTSGADNTGYVLSGAFVITILDFEEVGFYIAMMHRRRKSERIEEES